VKNSGDIANFIIMRETAIAAGSRRIFGATGAEADKAIQLADSVAALVNGLSADCTRADILALRDSILALPAVRQARLRAIRMFGLLSSLLTYTVDSKERAIVENEKKLQADRANAAITAVKALVASNPGPVVVQVLDCGSSSKVCVLHIL
jgi:alanyl-tRNA synthetase